MFDLLKLPDFKLAVKLEDKETVERILWNLGVDTKQDWEFEECIHRPLTNNNRAWEGLRVHGLERTDKEYLRSGYASLEAIAHSSSDKSLTRELLNLNPENNSVHEGDYSCSVYIDLIDIGGDCV